VNAPPAAVRTIRPALVVLAVVLLAVNLRTTVVSLPPLLATIERDLGLSGPGAGMLTALPVICMAIFAPAGHRLAHRFGAEATAFGSVALVGLGNGLRLFGEHVALLYLATFIAGVGVAVAGVVLPGLVKELFASRTGAMTGAYTVAMMLGATVAAATAVPLAQWLGSWQASLASWALPAALAAATWLGVTLRVNRPEPEAGAGRGRLPARSGTAWLLTAYFTLQAVLAYVVIGWLAAAFEYRGWSAAQAGWLLAINNLAQVASALVLPALTDRLRDRRWALIPAGTASLVGCVWLLAWPDTLPWLASIVLGVGIGAGFALALVLIVDYAADTAASTRLAALVFLVGYGAGAAVAPVLVGALRDWTGGFAAGFALLVASTAAQLIIATRLGPRRRATVH
jgi:CP family cyanate transporter-like MFS transporter